MSEMEKEVLEAAAVHAVEAFPHESCGLVVLRNDGKRVYVPCTNVASSPSEHFVLDPQDWSEAEELGEIVGVVHSHPGHPARPSEGDLACCEATEVEWTILRTDRDEVTGAVSVTETYAWTPTGWKAPLVGRAFHYGIQDCWMLARDWYKEELGIDLADVEHGPDGWWNDEDSPFSPYEDPANYERAGLVRVDEGPSRLGDLIVMQVRSRARKPNHVGVLIDDQRGIMLHHLYGALSDRVVYGGYWRETTRFVLRRKE